MRPNPTDFLVTPDLNKPEKWTYPIKFGAIRRMERIAKGHVTNLQKIIKGRTVAILLHGRSIKELETRINEFADYNFCYTSINRFSIMERKILSKIGKKLDIVFLMSEQEMPRRVEETKEFLNRKTNNCLMTTYSALSWLIPKDWNEIVEKYSSKLYIMPRLLCRPVYPISLALILDQLIMNKVKQVILFGADGFLLPSGKVTWDQNLMLNTYFDPGFFINERRASGLSFGTKHFNDTFRYDDRIINVLNCSKNSFYTPFPRISYNKLKELKRWI